MAGTSPDDLRSAFSALKANTSKNQPFEFNSLLSKDGERKLTVIVNVASKCGFTPQYAGLEKLNKDYKDKGLTLIGFPCNQFLFQEPGSAEEAATTCQRNYGVSFQIMEKINVNPTMLGFGSSEHEVYQYLKKQAPGSVSWNFNKYVVDGNGKVLKKFGAKDTPEQMEAPIKAYLVDGNDNAFA